MIVYIITGILSVIISFLNIFNWLFYVYYWNPAREKSLDSKLDIKERKLRPVSGPSTQSIDNAMRSVRKSINFMSSSVDKKRMQQSKKCWDMLMLISDRYPDLFKLLAAEKILTSKDLIHMTLKTRNKIVDTIPKGPLRDQVNAILSNFCIEDIQHASEEQDEVLGGESNRGGPTGVSTTGAPTRERKAPLQRNPMHDLDGYEDDVYYDPDEKNSSEPSESWDEFEMDLDDLTIGADSPRNNRRFDDSNDDPGKNIIEPF
jgi:hypothetical protein